MKKIALIVLMITLFVPSITIARPALEPGEEEVGLTIRPLGPILDFEVPDLAGNHIKTVDFRKNKIFVLRISNTSVAELNKPEIAIMNALAQKYIGKIAILDVISRDKSALESITEFYELTKALVTPAYDPEGEVAAAYGLKIYPLMLVADQNGKIIFLWLRSEDNLLITGEKGEMVQIRDRHEDGIVKALVAVIDKLVQPTE